jgi:hypothetical protein
MNHDMQIGDIVRIKTDGDLLRQPHGLTSRMSARPESEGQIGVIVAMAKRLYILWPRANVMVLGEVAEFDLDELEKVNESR